MTDKTIDLDQCRGMEAQKATDLRRLLAEVEANEHSLRLRQDELEAHLADAPAASWEALKLQKPPPADAVVVLPEEMKAG
jgi:hypothetical protein